MSRGIIIDGKDSNKEIAIKNIKNLVVLWGVK